jgi:hypothetical protein
LPKSGSASVENRTISKRSSPFKILDAEFERLLRLLQFRARHRARGIDDKRPHPSERAWFLCAAVGAARIRK